MDTKKHYFCGVNIIMFFHGRAIFIFVVDNIFENVITNNLLQTTHVKVTYNRFFLWGIFLLILPLT